MGNDSECMYLTRDWYPEYISTHHLNSKTTTAKQVISSKIGPLSSLWWEELSCHTPLPWKCKPTPVCLHIILLQEYLPAAKSSLSAEVLN
jgi:hypothetical protein